MKPTHGEFRPGAPTPTTSIEIEHCDGDGGGTVTHEIDCEQFGKDFEPCKLYVDTGKLPTDPYEKDTY